MTRIGQSKAGGRWRALLALAGCFWVWVAAVAQPPDGPPSRSYAPLPPQVMADSLAPEGSAALFVGVSEFVDDEGMPSNRITSIPYAVDDAVDLAYCFIKELGLVEARNTRLALSGNPRKDASRRRLEELRKGGVLVLDARESTVKRAVHDTAVRGAANKDARRDSGILVFHFSTHGFTTDGGNFLLCQDSSIDADLIEDTSVSVEFVEKQLARSQAPRGLVLIDACREHLDKTNKSSLASVGMASRFLEAFRESHGKAVLLSTTSGGYSYDDPSLQNGVFTWYILKGLQGEAESDRQGLITVEKLATYVDERIRDWVKSHRPEHEEISKGVTFRSEGMESRKIPLAVKIDARAEYQEFFQESRELLDILELHVDGSGVPAVVYDQVSDYLATAPLEDCAPVLNEIRRLDRNGARYAERFSAWWDEYRREESPSTLLWPLLIAGGGVVFLLVLAIGTRPFRRKKTALRPSRDPKPSAATSGIPHPDAEPVADFRAILALLADREPGFRTQLWSENALSDPKDAELARAEHAHGEQSYHIGDTVRFCLWSEHDCYVTLLNIGSSGRITVLLPNKFRPDNRVPGGTTVRFPEPDWPCKFRQNGPAGREQIIALATRDPFDPFRGDFGPAFLQPGDESLDHAAKRIRAKLLETDGFVWSEARCSFRVLG